MKKILGLAIACLMIFSTLCCFSIVGINVQKTVIEDIYGVNVSCDDNYMTIYPFETAVFGVKVTNTGDMLDTYTLDCPDLIDCCYWSSLNSYEITLHPDETRLVILTVQPYFIEENTYTITVRATSHGNPWYKDSVPTYTTVIIKDRVVDVTSDRPIYNAGEPVVLLLTNIDDQTIEGNPTFEVFNEFDELVYGCYPDVWLILEPGENFTDLWFPNLPQGKYTVEGSFLTYTDIYYDNESFFILGDNLIETSTDKNVYKSGEEVNLIITNIGDTVISGNPSFQIYNFNDELVHEVYIYLWIELYPNEAFDTMWWDQKDLDGNQVSDGGYRLIGKFTMSQDKYYVDDYRFYIGDNLPPGPPRISGPTSGVVGIEYDYVFSLPVDPEGDLIFLRVDWGIGGPSKWYGPYPSGTSNITLTYKWNKMGVFNIRAQAMDEYGSVSEWAEFKVTMPRNKNRIFPQFLNLFDSFLDIFPILRLILQGL